MSGQGRAHALHIHFVSTATLGLNEKLMPVLIGEAYNLGLDGGAVARANTLDHTIEHTG